MLADLSFPSVASSHIIQELYSDIMKRFPDLCVKISKGDSILEAAVESILKDTHRKHDSPAGEYSGRKVLKTPAIDKNVSRACSKADMLPTNSHRPSKGNKPGKKKIFPPPPGPASFAPPPTSQTPPPPPQQQATWGAPAMPNIQSWSVPTQSGACISAAIANASLANAALAMSQSSALCSGQAMNKSSISIPFTSFARNLKTSGAGFGMPPIFQRHYGRKTSAPPPSGGPPRMGHTVPSIQDAAPESPPTYFQSTLQTLGLEKSPTTVYKRTREEPVSTFSADVDTSSYSYIRRLLKYDKKPAPHEVRIEEMINYFDYDYPVPKEKTEPFEPTVVVMDCPWNQGRKVLSIGIKGYDIDPASRPFCNLVFLIDVSGSMYGKDRLGLAKKSIALLLDSLRRGDSVAIVTYASGAKVALPPTPVSEKDAILRVLCSLRAQGSTNGTGGLEMAYGVAEANFDPDAVNRILLLTDGDFNIGLTTGDALKQYIEVKRETGIFLSVLGFGMDNYQDATMKALANNGNGVAVYIDSIEEAHKVMVKEAQSTIFPIAKDVKFQVEFNPRKVAEYRLIGYEKRLLKREDFNNDKVDAGDIGAGHTVTALYEFTPTSNPSAAAMDDLRYGSWRFGFSTKKHRPDVAEETDTEYAFLKIRYKLPDEETSRLITKPISERVNLELLERQGGSTGATLRDVRFALAVAGFARLLRGDKDVGKSSYFQVLAMTENNLGEDPFGYRKEFLSMVRQVYEKRCPSWLP